MSQHFKAYEGKPLAIHAAAGSLTGVGAAGQKPEYPPSPCCGGQSLAWHRAEVFAK